MSRKGVVGASYLTIFQHLVWRICSIWTGMQRSVVYNLFDKGCHRKASVKAYAAKTKHSLEHHQWIWTNTKCLSSTLLMVPFTVYLNQLCPNVSDQSTHNTNSSCEVWLVLRLTWLKHGWKKCNLRFKHHSWYKDTTGVNTTTIPRRRGE